MEDSKDTTVKLLMLMYGLTHMPDDELGELDDMYAFEDIIKTMDIKNITKLFNFDVDGEKIRTEILDEIQKWYIENGAKYLN